MGMRPAFLKNSSVPGHDTLEGKCTPFLCEACQVPLCVILDRDCHKYFHS